MASSLLRFGRIRPLKCFQVESWGILRSNSVASFCTQTGDPAKPAKKTKTVSKTAEAPDERATLLAYKTAVAFPVRLSHSGAFPAQSLGVAEPVASSTAAAETVVAVAATASTPDDAVPPATGSSEPCNLAADGSSSSSSSDSDSDSDSDSEDEKSDVNTETKTSQPQLSESTVKKEAENQEVTSKVTEDNHKDEKEVPSEPEDNPVRAAEAVKEAAPASVVATTETTRATVETPSVRSEESVDSAPEICSATEDTLEVPSIKVSAEAPVKLSLDVREDAAFPAVPDAQTHIPTEVVTEPVTPEKGPTDVPTGTTQPASAEAPAQAEAATAEVTAKTAAEVSEPVESTEALMDRAPVVAEAAEEKLAEAGVEQSEEAPAAAPPEPEEPFDNSTYKNYQHHNYTPYTFVDLDVEMAKFRLPQPSSGRPSPRH